MEITRYINLGFITLGAVAWWLFNHVFVLIWSMSESLHDTPILGKYISLTTILGLVVAVGLTFYLWRHEKVIKLATEVAVECSKVTWPKWPETKSATIVVIVVTLIISCILAVFDFTFQHLTDFLLGV